MAVIDLIDRFWAAILPLPTDRVPYTLSTAPLMLTASLPLIAASYLRLRHPGLPLLWRMTFALIAIYATLRLSLSHYNPFTTTYVDGSVVSTIPVDFIMGAASGVWTLLILELMFASGEENYDVRGTEEYRRWSARTKRNGEQQNGNGPDHFPEHGYSLERPKYFPGASLPLEIDLLASIRGLGYGRGLDQRDMQFQAGYSAFIAAQELTKRPLSEAKQLKWTALRRTLRVTVLSYLLVDTIECFYRHPLIFPGVRNYQPCSIDDASHGVLGRVGPWAITVLLCIYLICAMQFASTASYVMSLLLTRAYDAPITISRFEPLTFYRPHLSTSLRAMWGIHWHAYFRRIFLVFGFSPGRRLGERLGLPRRVAVAMGIMATFLVSGLLHELCLEAVLPHFNQWDPAASKSGKIRTPQRGFGAMNFGSTRFFLAQGVGLIVEDVWASLIEPWLATTLFGKRNAKGTSDKEKPLLVTGKVRSVLGWIWCMSYMTYHGHDLMDVSSFRWLVSASCCLTITFAQVWLHHGVATTTISAQFTRPFVRMLFQRASAQ